MAKARFTKNFDFRPAARPGITIFYRAGSIYANCTDECIQKAQKANVVENVETNADRIKKTKKET